MREILFRGRPVSGGEYFFFSQIWKDNCKDDFVYGSLVVDNDRYYISVSAMRSINVCVNNGTTSMIEVIPETVDQYIGLLDKNDNKIFESDIVVYKSVPMLVRWEENSAMFVVDYIVNGEPHMNTLFGYGRLEVIGNIHDNRELLG